MKKEYDLQLTDRWTSFAWDDRATASMPTQSGESFGRNFVRSNGDHDRGRVHAGLTLAVRFRGGVRVTVRHHHRDRSIASQVGSSCHHDRDAGAAAAPARRVVLPLVVARIVVARVEITHRDLQMNQFP
jgi:hypothetical protein